MLQIFTEPNADRRGKGKHSRMRMLSAAVVSCEGELPALVIVRKRKSFFLLFVRLLLLLLLLLMMTMMFVYLLIPFLLFLGLLCKMKHPRVALGGLEKSPLHLPDAGKSEPSL